MPIENPEIVYDPKRKVAYEFFHLEMSRKPLKRFIKNGAALRKFDGTVNLGICQAKTGHVIQKHVSSMNIGDYYEGHRIRDIEFVKLKIGEEQHDCVAFIYKLE
jgi:hypothetical protein